MERVKILGAITLFATVFTVAGLVEADVAPIAVSGWNHDMVINNPAPYNTVTGTMDGGFNQVENWTWVEAGTYDNPDGNPQTISGLVAGTHSSLTGNGTFVFQPFDQSNVVGLDGGQTGTLTLDTPASYTAIALYGASGFGAKSATVTLTFDDASTTVLNVANGTGIGTDWFNNNADVAFAVGARGSNKSEEGYTRIFIQENSAIHINESYFALSAVDQAKLLTSVAVTNDGGDRMAIFALSGELVPEPGSLALIALGSLVMARTRQRR